MPARLRHLRLPSLAAVGMVVSLTALAASGTPAAGSAAQGQDAPLLSAAWQRLDAGTGWPRQHFWRAEINGSAAVEVAVPVLERSPGDYWLRRRDLLAWRLRLPEAAVHVHDGEPYLPLRALPVLSQRVDTRQGVLFLGLPPEAYAGRAIDSNANPVPALSDPVPGALLDYNLFTRSDGERLRASGLLDLRAFHGTRSASGRWLVDEDGQGLQAVRLESALAIDTVASLTRLELGDALAPGGSLGPTVRFGGLQWGRDFAIMPQRRNFPVPGFEGQAELPSTVDLFINQARRARESVSPGTFTLVDAPVITGAGRAELVVVDALGREQRFVEDFYVNSAALKPGLSDFSLALGVARQDFGLRSNAYGGILVNALYRRGLSRRTTAEVFARLRDERYATGLGVTTTLAQWATMELGASHAGSHGEGGWLAQAALQRVSPGWNAVVRVRAAEPGFGSGLEQASRLRRELVMSAGRSFGRVRLTASRLERRNRYIEDFSRTSLDGSYRFRKGPSVTLSVFRQKLDAGAANGFSLLLVWPLGGRMTATASVQQDDGDWRHQQQVSRSPDGDLGTAWRVASGGGSGRSQRLQAELRQQHAPLSYTLRGERAAGRSSASLRLEGAVGVLGTTAFASQSTRDALGLVRVPGFADVPVFRDNRLVGHTNHRGELVVPQLRAFERNRIRIGTAQLPIAARIGSANREIVPARASAAAQTFAVEHSLAVQLRVLRAGGGAVPAGASVRVNGRSRAVPVARGGLLYLEAMEPGTAEVELIWHDGRCRLLLELPADAGPLPDLGTRSCS